MLLSCNDRNKCLRYLIQIRRLHRCRLLLQAFCLKSIQIQVTAVYHAYMAKFRSVLFPGKDLLKALLQAVAPIPT